MIGPPSAPREADLRAQDAVPDWLVFLNYGFLTIYSLEIALDLAVYLCLRRVRTAPGVFISRASCPGKTNNTNYSVEIATLLAGPREAPWETPLCCNTPPTKTTIKNINTQTKDTILCCHAQAARRAGSRGKCSPACWIPSGDHPLTLERCSGD